MAVVYQHRRLDTNEVFYVGKGRNEKRAYSRNDRTKYWHNIVDKVGYGVDVLINGCSNDEACEIEKGLIESYGRIDLGTGQLINLTQGGDGGYNHSPITRKNISNKIKNNVQRGKKISIAMENREKTYWAKQNIIDAVSKPVIQCLLDGTEVREFDSATEAASVYNVNPRAITNVLIGLSKTSCGFYWKYKNI